MSWSPEQHAHVVGLLRQLLRPDKEVLAWVSNEVQNMQTHSEFPALLAQVLGHGCGAAQVEGDTGVTVIGIRQAAGVLLRQHIQGLCKQVRAEKNGDSTSTNSATYARVAAQVVEVPLLVALCSGDGQIRTAASCCISALLSLEAVIPSNPEHPWALSLVSRLEQLAEAQTLGDEGGGVVSTLAGVARSLGIIFEDSALDAIHGALGGYGGPTNSDAGNTTQFALRMYALLSHVLQVQPQGASPEDVLEVRLHALRTVGGISFVGAIDDSYFDDSDDDEEDGRDGYGGSIRVEGVSPNRRSQQEIAAKKEEKVASQAALKEAEVNLTSAVLGCLGSVVEALTAELKMPSSGSRLHAIKSLEVTVQAMLPLIAYWDTVGAHILNNVLPTLLQWLSEIGAAHSRDMSISGPTSSFLATCVDFITEIAQQIDDEAVAACLTQNIAEILHGLLCAMELDAIAIEDFSVGPDANVEDEEGDVLFIQNRRRNKGTHTEVGTSDDGGAIGEDGEDFADNAFDDEEGGDGDDAINGTMSHPLRSAVAWCVSNLSMVVPPAVLRNATFQILSGVVDGQVAAWKGASDFNSFISHVPNWSPLEAALSLLAEALDHTSMDFGGDEDAESIMASATASSTALDLCMQLLTSEVPHPAGPVRQSAAALMRRITIGMFGFNTLILMDDADILGWSQQEVTAFTLELTRRVNQVTGTLTSLISTDANKSVRLTCISGVVSILHRHFVEDDDDDDEDEDEDGEDGTNDGGNGEDGSDGLDVQLVHVTDDTIRNFFSVTTCLPQLKMKCRVAWYRSLSRVVKMEAESGADGSTSVFMSCIVAVFEQIQLVWGSVATTSFETYESLAIGELVCDLLDAISEMPGASCPTAIVSWLWTRVCEVILNSKVDPTTKRFAPTNSCWGPLSLDAIIMAVEIASCACDSLDGLDKAATSELFGGTTLVGHVAGLTELLVNTVTSNQPAQSELGAELLANLDQSGELLRASFGLIADFITSADASSVTAVANTVLSMIFKIIQKECQKRSTPAVSNYNGDTNGSDATSAALANSLWCFLALLNKIVDGCTDRQVARVQLRDTLISMCPEVFGQPQELSNLSKGMFFLLSSLQEEGQDMGGMAGIMDTTGRSMSTTAKFNCLFVIVRCAATFESSWFSSEDAVSNAVMLAETTIQMSEESFDSTELLEVGASMGEVLSIIAPLVQDTKKFVKLTLLLGAYLADHLNQSRKYLGTKRADRIPANERKNLNTLLQTCHAVWLPIVKSAALSVGGAAGVQTLFPKKKKKLVVALGDVFFTNH